MEQISKCSHGGIRGAAVDVAWRRLQPWRTLSGAGPGSELQPILKDGLRGIYNIVELGKREDGMTETNYGLTVTLISLCCSKG